jgi:hypothetical protein
VHGVRVYLVRVGMADPVFADPFHDPPVAAPVLGHVAHVVIGGVVDGARAAGALPIGMDAPKTFTTFELPYHVNRNVVGFVRLVYLVEDEVEWDLAPPGLELHGDPGDLHGRSSNSGWENRFTMSVLT